MFMEPDSSSFCLTHLFLNCLDPRIRKVACKNPDCPTARHSRCGAVKPMPLAHGRALGCTGLREPGHCGPPDLPSRVVAPWVPDGGWKSAFLNQEPQVTGVLWQFWKPLPSASTLSI